MTIQIVTPNKSKADLLNRLVADPTHVVLVEPLPMGSRRFTADAIPPGEAVLVVCDPPTRQRFAQIIRVPDGSFRVK